MVTILKLLRHPPLTSNHTAIEGKIKWLNHVMVSEFGPQVVEEAIIYKDKWRYDGIAFIDDHPDVRRGANGECTAEMGSYFIRLGSFIFCSLGNYCVPPAKLAKSKRPTVNTSLYRDTADLNIFAPFRKASYTTLCSVIILEPLPRKTTDIYIGLFS